MQKSNKYSYFAAAAVVLLVCGRLSVTQAFVPHRLYDDRHHSIGFLLRSQLSDDSSIWNGEVTSGGSNNGKIEGCTIQPVNPDDPMKTEWIVTIDGEQADLGKFSQAIYQKITRDAKQTQRFQGFRPGTIPPHIEPTYRAFAMDECARETVLEALQQNNIRPFTTTREEMFLKHFQIPPPPVLKKKSKKNKKKSSKKTQGVHSAMEAKPELVEEDKEQEPELKEQPTVLAFETMKEAVDAGWRPGQSFSFVAVDVKGQKLKDSSDTKDAKPLGVNYTPK